MRFFPFGSNFDLMTKRNPVKRENSCSVFPAQSGRWRIRTSDAVSRMPHFPTHSGGGEIRTHGTLSGSPHFKCGALDHSATPPLCSGLRFLDEPKVRRNREQVRRVQSFDPFDKLRAGKLRTYGHPPPLAGSRCKR